MKETSQLAMQPLTDGSFATHCRSQSKLKYENAAQPVPGELTRPIQRSKGNGPIYIGPLIVMAKPLISYFQNVAIWPRRAVDSRRSLQIMAFPRGLSLTKAVPIWLASKLSTRSARTNSATTTVRHFRSFRSSYHKCAQG